MRDEGRKFREGVVVEWIKAAIVDWVAAATKSLRAKLDKDWLYIWFQMIISWDPVYNLQK